MNLIVACSAAPTHVAGKASPLKPFVPVHLRRVVLVANHFNVTKPLLRIDIHLASGAIFFFSPPCDCCCLPVVLAAAKRARSYSDLACNLSVRPVKVLVNQHHCSCLPLVLVQMPPFTLILFKHVGLHWTAYFRPLSIHIYTNEHADIFIILSSSPSSVTPLTIFFFQGTIRLQAFFSTWSTPKYLDDQIIAPVQPCKPYSPLQQTFPTSIKFFEISLDSTPLK